MDPSFSILISVYINDKEKWFKDAFDSLLNQTLKPSQILIIKDGPVSKGILKLIRNYIAKDFKD